ncbi:hypothetical protein EVX74_014120 [Acinetobacter lwoffii]|jgi:hypothetical protein|uniref:Alpha/beta hydrolase n=1 Tax=Acinetobacter lwoffii TaxID=28090 RepID=A0AAJ3AEY0_ACILW|nr:MULTISPECIES: hypothetical protein [Acinetobacter]ENU63772.1 hypothetical protein F980_00520 [Acinetobacter lwoffii NIPH 715]MCU4615898.1 hypothetical protein [Acinetobacter lwoffii]NKS44468.1 hypothetical protein [Acinetobacter lwoffii]QGR75209.1 hypothetical protein FOB21_11585 [Acinetobacter lwoffii]QJB47622.1 hypothetical protein HGD77_02035 [Acinetobacter sp. NEB149]
MDKQIVFEDEHIRAIFMPGSSSELIFSFGDLITRAKGLNINAEKSLAKFEFNVLGIMPKHKSWFPQGSMWNMLQAIAELIAPFQQRIAYGGSMGGYAAIKYSRALGVQRVVAMVPQYSIDPEDVHDARYNMFYQPELNANMRVAAEDIDNACEYIIVYDPYCAEDRAHYLKLEALIPHHHVLHLPFTGHDAIAVLASSELLYDFLVHEYEPSYFYQKMRRVKKNSKFYYRKVIENVLPRHRMALGHILKNNDLQLDNQFFDASQKQVILRELLRNKQVDQHDLLKLGIHVNLPQENRQLLLDQYGHGLVFNVISHKIESYAEGAIALNHKFLIPIYAKGNGLLSINLNDERYLVVMNDRHIMKLIKEQDELSLGMHPILMKRYSDFYMFSYKQLNLSTNEYGATAFIDESNKNTQFMTQNEIN